MTRLATALSAAALLAFVAAPAGAAELTCGDLADLVRRNTSSCSDANSSGTADAFDAGLATGTIFGATDVVAGLLSLANAATDPDLRDQGACVSRLVRERADAYVAALADEITECVSIDPARAGYLEVIDAILRLCPSPRRR